MEAASYKKIIANNKCILSESKYSDFTYIVKGNEFKVHKNILTAASPVFDKVFSANLEESGKNKCHKSKISSLLFANNFLTSFILENCQKTLMKKIHRESFS